MIDLLSLKLSIANAIEEMCARPKLIHEEAEQLLFRIEEPRLPYLDVAGFTILDLRKAWEEREAGFLACVERALGGSRGKGVEISLTFLYDPNQEDELLEYIVRLERDEFYCKKFAVGLVKDNWAEALSRLPFARISRQLTNQSSGLPPAAHSLLINSGIKPEYARLMVQQQRANVDRFWDKCVDGSIWSADSSRQHYLVSYPQTAGLPQPARLTRLTLSGFRGYSTPQTLNLDADLVVLAGPNGLGKTSIFDAVEFVATGSVRRLGSSEPLYNRRHEEPSFVEMAFKVGGREHVVKRETGSPTLATLDGREGVSRKGVLKALTGALRDEHTERFVNLFCATHLHPQEQLFLIEAVGRDSTLDADVLGRMLAMQDYERALIVLKQLIQRAEQQKGKETGQLDKLDEQIRTLEQELKDLRKYSTADALTNEPGALLTQLSALEEEVAATIGSLPSPLPPVPRERVRTVRSMVDGHLQAQRKLAGRLDNVPAKLARWAELVRQKPSVQALLDAQNDRLASLKNKATQVKERIKVLDEQMRMVKTLSEKDAERRAALQWGIATCDRMLETNSILSSTRETLQALNEQDKRLRNRGTELVHKSESLRNQRDRLGKQIGELRARLTRTVELLRRVETQGLVVEGRIRGESDQDLTAIQEVKAKLSSLSGNIAGVERRIGELDLRLSELESRLDSRRRLMSGLLHHVTNSICPMCGHVHATREDLIKRVENMMAVSSEELSSLQTERRDLQEQHTSLLTQKHQLSVTLNTLVTRVDQWRALAAEVSQWLGMREAGPDDLKNVVAQLTSDLKRREEEYHRLEYDTNELVSSLSSLNREIGILQEQRNAAVETESKSLAEIESMQRESLRRGLPWPLDKGTFLLELETLSAKEKEHTRSIQENRRALTSAQDEAGEVGRLIGAIAGEVKSLGDQLGALDDEAGRLAQEVREAGFTGIQDAADRVHVRQEQTAKVVSKLDDALRRLLVLEDALDSAARSSRYVEARRKLSALERERTQYEKGSKALNYLATRLHNLVSALEAERNSALSKYCDVQGEIVSAIQARLRPVYGFGKTRLHVDRSGSVVVSLEPLASAGDKNPLRPRDYWSSAQLNTLGLSIYLSVALTQDWSGLRTILLDDPVQHFDDLNTYAFLDLLLRLIDNENYEVKPQVILSTCDSAMLRLMVKKYRPLQMEKRVRYYLFESLTPNGPVIRELSGPDTI